jgi:hypothetical protein
VTYLPDGNINFELLQLLHQQIRHMLQCQVHGHAQLQLITLVNAFGC